VAAPVARNGLALAKGALPHRLGAALKNDAQIIGGHWYGLCQGKTVTVRQIRDLGEVPYAPLSVLRSQPNVEVSVALGGVTTVYLVRTIEVENATRSEGASAPVIRPLQVAQGVMWIMLMHTSASAR
jgi:hypothetical protein